MIAMQEGQPDIVIDEELLVRRWRFERLTELGVPDEIAGELTETVDARHEVEQLVDRGCPPELAAEIVR